MNKSNKKVGVLAISILLFIYFFTINLHTPLFDDDLYISRHQTFISLWNQAYADYFHWNGRAVGQTLWRILASSNLYITSLIISLGSVGLILLIQFFGNGLKSNNFFGIVFQSIFSFSMLMLFAPVIGQTMFWRAGAGNYLLTTVLILLFIYPYFQWFHESKRKNSKVLIYLYPLLAFFAGWSNENTSGGGLLLVLLYLLIGHYQKQLKWSLSQMISLTTYICGYLFLILAPGNAVRTKATMPPEWFEQSALTHFKNGFTLVSKTLFHHYSILILVVIFLSIWLTINKIFIPVIEAMIWFTSGIATLYALSLSPLGQDGGRSFFGGVILIIISLVKLSFALISSYSETRVIQHFVIVILALFALTGLVKTTVGTLDAIKANNAMQARYRYLEDRKNSRQVIKVKPLSYYPKKSFSINYGLEELSTTDPHAFPNEGYNWYYNFSSGIIMK